MRWAEIAAHEPALGAAAHDRLIKPGVLLIGTTRRDGSARISGVEPLIMDGELWLSMMPGSAKVADLDRDPRIQLHSIISGPEAAIEIKLRGTARREPDRGVQERYARTVADELPWEPVVGDFALFAVDIAEVTYQRDQARRQTAGTPRAQPGPVTRPGRRRAGPDRGQAGPGRSRQWIKEPTGQAREFSRGTGAGGGRRARPSGRPGRPVRRTPAR
jgi:hypothetical protein